MDRDLINAITIKINILSNEKIALSNLISLYKQNFYLYTYLKRDLNSEKKFIKRNSGISECEKFNQIQGLENSVKAYKAICHDLRQKIAIQSKKVKRLEQEYKIAFDEFMEISRQNKGSLD